MTVDQPRSSKDAAVDVCLVEPPYAAVTMPSLGSAILAAACRKRGLRVELVYGNIVLASQVGYDVYKSIGKVPREVMLGERLFVPHAYPEHPRRTLGDGGELAAEWQSIIDGVAGRIGPFLHGLARRIVALRPRIVGISSTFQQNLATFALARVLKEMAPEICIVVGGANIAMPMGAGLMQVFPWIDHFFSGEADVEFPDFCRQFVQGHHRPDHKLVECAPITDMRVVCSPDFSDYMAALREAQDAGHLPAGLPESLTMESSRGCWWGEKHHCVFCGLNGATMKLRQKTSARVLDEIQELSRAWNVKHIAMTDNIMPLDYLDTLLPALANWKGGPSLFYEVKANLRDEHLDVMARAGVVVIQPGIESLSSNVLRLMRKGVSASQNIVLLRSCRSRNIQVSWNYLCGISGEQIDDYLPVLSLMPKIEHLQPPNGLHSIVVDRFSPYHNTPERFEITKVAPFRGYHGLYPQDAPVADIAYHFTGKSSTPVLRNKELCAALHAAVQRWKALWAPPAPRPMLRVIDNNTSRIVIVDTRSVAREAMTIVSREMDATLRDLERPRSRAGVSGTMAEHVEYLLDRHFVVEHEGNLLSIVTRSQRVAPPEAAADAQVLDELLVG